jgi:hypothetical protein
MLLTEAVPNSRYNGISTSPFLPYFAVFLKSAFYRNFGQKKRELKKLPKVLGEWWGVFKRRLHLY